MVANLRHVVPGCFEGKGNYAWSAHGAEGAKQTFKTPDCMLLMRFG